MCVGDSLELNPELELSESPPFDLVRRGNPQFLSKLVIIVYIGVEILVSAQAIAPAEVSCFFG